jgi:5'(3')-deoxyribonucleotidase
MSTGKYNKIYLDMDGVLADFDSAASLIIDKNSPDFSKKKLWQAIAKYDAEVQPFFENLSLMEDALILTEFLNKTFENIEILTASGSTPRTVKEQKIKWATKNFPAYKINVVRKSPDKARYASQDAILIDDREKSIMPFMAAGGVGILYKSASSTIDALMSIIKENQNEL